MSRLYQAPDDFEAIIRIFPPSERGRLTPAFNGIRWDFAYADDPLAHLSAIWPDFHDQSGESFGPDCPLPADVFLNARMTIVSEELRSTHHRSRIRPGMKFFCHEGTKRVAEGRVLQITGLLLPRFTRPLLSRELLNSGK